jgi:hypothetical protein
MEGVDPVEIQEDLVLANFLNRVGHIRDGIMSCLDVFVKGDVITAESDEGFGGFRGNYKAGSNRRIGRSIEILAESFEFELSMSEQLRVDGSGLGLEAKGKIRTPI